jgi:hypothetical protein
MRKMPRFYEFLGEKLIQVERVATNGGSLPLSLNDSLYPSILQRDSSWK